ncbi:MAG TPA: hypothetical protein VKX25_14075 [Bryobacteraceae bacterium]|jgi:hypothetical protein|nr:hypothetical protein [Bryobacteraceae bacterium]
MRLLALSSLCLCALAATAAESTVKVTELSPHLLLLATSTGNVIASVGPDGALLIGTPSAASTPEINRILEAKTKSAVRYLVIWPEDLAHSQGDAGWGKLGAFVAMQEKALERLGGHVMGTSRPLPPELQKLNVDRPRVAFSEVITFDLNDDAIHVVHQRSGYSDADAIAHFHRDNLVYLGEVFPGDGYPLLDPAQGAKLDGLLNALNSWSGGAFRIVPVYGSVASGADLKQFHDMIAAVRDRIQQSIDAHKTESEILAQHPTADFDSRWGHGRVTPDEFVREIYAALTQK